MTATLVKGGKILSPDCIVYCVKDPAEKAGQLDTSSHPGIIDYQDSTHQEGGKGKITEATAPGLRQRRYHSKTKVDAREDSGVYSSWLLFGLQGGDLEEKKGSAALSSRKGLKEEGKPGNRSISRACIPCS